MNFVHSVDVIDLILKGLTIGIIASAPMGPIGILVVQRTLKKGRWYGFATGVGAAMSDMLYAVITGLGMSLVLDFIEKPSTMLYLRLIAGCLFFVIGRNTAVSSDAEFLYFFLFGEASDLLLCRDLGYSWHLTTLLSMRLYRYWACSYGSSYCVCGGDNVNSVSGAGDFLRVLPVWFLLSARRFSSLFAV